MIEQLKLEEIEYNPERMDCEECKRILDSLYNLHTQTILSVRDQTSNIIATFAVVSAILAIILVLPQKEPRVYDEIIMMLFFMAIVFLSMFKYNSARIKTANHIRKQIYNIRRLCRQKECPDSSNVEAGEGLPCLSVS